jgi:hypothetical protein
MTNFDKLYESVINTLITEKKKKLTKISDIPTNAEIMSKKRAPVHKPTMLIKPKKGGYNRGDKSWKKDY